jgi:hypothetical protein
MRMIFSVMQSITYVVITVMKARLKVKIIWRMYIKLKKKLQENTDGRGRNGV